MKKILVTGASGYIGRHVVKTLLDMGHEVVASDLVFNGVDERAARCDVPIFDGSPDIYERLGRPDVLIHLAWRDGFVHNSDRHMLELSNHVRFCRDMMTGGLPALSVMGTMHEVGYWEGAIDENTPCNPLSQYGIAKNALRQSLMLSAQNAACKLHWLRAYYITGDDTRASNIFSKLMKAAEEGKTEFPFTSGKNRYDFISIDRLAYMIAVASLDEEETGIINVCTGEPITLGERVESFIAEHQLPIRLQYGAFPDRAYDSPGVWGDAERIKAILRRYEQGAQE